MARLFGQVPPLFDESTTPVFGGAGGAVVVSVDVGWSVGVVDVVVAPASVVGLLVVFVVGRQRQVRRLSSFSVENTSSSAALPTDPASSAEPHPTPTSATQSSPLARAATPHRFPNPRNMTTSPSSYARRYPIHPSVLRRRGKAHATASTAGPCGRAFRSGDVPTESVSEIADALGSEKALERAPSVDQP